MNWQILKRMALSNEWGIPRFLWWMLWATAVVCELLYIRDHWVAGTVCIFMLLWGYILFRRDDKPVENVINDPGVYIEINETLSEQVAKGYTQITLRNPRTGEERILNLPRVFK